MIALCALCACVQSQDSRRRRERERQEREREREFEKEQEARIAQEKMARGEAPEEFVSQFLPEEGGEEEGDVLGEEDEDDLDDEGKPKKRKAPKPKVCTFGLRNACFTLPSC